MYIYCHAILIPKRQGKDREGLSTETDWAREGRGTDTERA